MAHCCLLLLLPQFRNIIPCEVLFYIEVTFWALSIDLGISGVLGSCIGIKSPTQTNGEV